MVFFICVVSAFRCAYCYFLNPARKTRPQAPRLPEVTGETKPSSETPFSTSGVDEENNQSVLGDDTLLLYSNYIFFHSFLCQLFILVQNACKSKLKKMISNYQGQPSLMMCLLQQTPPKSPAHQRPQSPALRQTAKPRQSPLICPLRNLTESRICLPWKWNKTRW